MLYTSRWISTHTKRVLKTGAGHTHTPNHPYIERIETLALKPLNDRIIVKALEAEEKSSGGIYLPDSAREKPQQGKVLAVGPGKLLDNGKTVAMEVKPDDVVYYAKYGGTEVKIGTDELVILRQDDVLAVVEK